MKVKYIKPHNNYDLTIGKTYKGSKYKDGWIAINQDDKGNTVLYRKECFEIQSEGMVGMDLEIENIARSKCCRCNYVNEVSMTDKDLDTPLINEICLNTLNYKGEIIEDLAGENYYICDDCWNDLLNFFEGEDKNE